MIKRDKSFKLPKSVKTQMAFILDSNKKNLYKNAMIDAAVKGSILVKTKKQQKENASNDEA
jgi:hypothetical protein